MTRKEILRANILTAEHMDNVTPQLEKLCDSMRKSTKKHSKEKRKS